MDPVSFLVGAVVAVLVLAVALNVSDCRRGEPWKTQLLEAEQELRGYRRRCREISMLLSETTEQHDLVALSDGPLDGRQLYVPLGTQRLELITGEQYSLQGSDTGILEFRLED